MSKRTIKDLYGKYSSEAIERMIRNISIDYGRMFSSDIISKITSKNSRKEILSLILKHYDLFTKFKNGIVKVKYHIAKENDSGNPAYVQCFKNNYGYRKYEVHIYNYKKDILEETEKNLFIISLAHELGHIRYYEDEYKYSHIELAVDVLYLTLGYSKILYDFYKENGYCDDFHLGYIEAKNLPEILNMIEERKKIIYL